MLFPWPTLRLVVMPLGLVRVAYYTSFLCVLRFGEDRRGGALLVSAWTLLRMPARPGGGEESALRFIEKRLTRLKALRGAAVVATGLGAARRGELDTARALLHAVWNLDSAACPVWAYKMASEWLCVDAVAQGDWRQVGRLSTGLGPYSPLTRFLGGCAERFVESGTSLRLLPSDRALFWLWLRAPHRQATWPLLQRAQNSTPQAPSAPAQAAVAGPQPADLCAALRELVTLLSAEHRVLTPGQFVQVCRTWEAALKNPLTQRQLTERTLSLGQGGPGGPDAVLRELRSQVAAVVGVRLRESGLPIGQLLGDGTADAGATELGVAAAHTVRTQLLEEIEQACDALHDRTIDKRALPVPDEWREWAAVLARYRRVCDLGGQAVRRLAWAPLHREACSFAVWLWNERREKVLANAVFRFLLSEAETLGDESRLTLARKNVACGI